jgi:hypothetical protein
MSVGRITLYGANEFLMSFFTKSTAAPPEMYDQQRRSYSLCLGSRAG